MRSAALVVLPLLALACASSGHETAPHEAQRPLTDAEQKAMLEKACGDVERFAGLSGVDPRSKSTARSALEKTAHAYIDMCGTKDAIDLLSKLVEFPTVSERESPKDGPSFKRLAAFLAEWSKGEGLTFNNVGENDAWEIGWGNGAPSVGFVMHADVVPVDEDAEVERKHGQETSAAPAPNEVPPGWSRPPFQASVADGKVFGRGTEDDKGPIAAALVVMRTLARLHLEPKGRIMAIMGTGEEGQWEGMVRYAQSKEPKPAFVISVDADYPVVVAESGFVAWSLAAPLAPKDPPKRAKHPSACATAVDARAGQFLTQVPGEGTLVLSPPKNETEDHFVSRVQAASAEVAKGHGTDYRFELQPDGSNVKLRVLGASVHSSTADQGHNAMWAVAEVGDRIGLCEGGIATMLRVVEKYFAGDHWGKRLQLAYEDPLMGALLVTPTMLRVDKDRVTLGVNMRRPRGMNSEAFGKKLDHSLAELKQKIDPSITELEGRNVGEPAVANTEGPLVSTLLDIYRTATGDGKAQPISVRGGTYARLFPGAVSFGPSIPGEQYRGHAPDEFIQVRALELMTKTLLEAAIRLDALEPPQAPAVSEAH
jgi:predicted dipeptidase